MRNPVLTGAKAKKALILCLDNNLDPNKHAVLTEKTRSVK